MFCNLQTESNMACPLWATVRVHSSLTNMASSQLICSYLLWPFAYVMGVDVSDCRKVAELIGFKVFINELVAYKELGKLIDNSKVLDVYDGAWEWLNGDILLTDTGVTLVGGVISVSGHRHDWMDGDYSLDE